MIKKKETADTKHKITEHFHTLLNYASSNQNFKCFYCKAKEEMPFLNKETEQCFLTKEEEKNFLPREIFHTFNDEVVQDTPDLGRYCATFLLILFLKQHMHFIEQVVSLAADEPLKHSEILASTSPLYHWETKLIHMGGRIGIGGTG